MYEEDSGEDDIEGVWHSSNKEYTSRTEKCNKKEERAYKTIGGHKKTWGGIKGKNEGKQDEITETKEEGIETYNWDEHREM